MIGVSEIIRANGCYEKWECRFFRYTLWALIIGLIFPVVNNGSFITNLMPILTTGLSLISIFSYFTHHSIKSLTKYVLFFFITAVYMLIVGIVGGSLTLDKTRLLMEIGNDFQYVALFLLGGIYSTEERYMDIFNAILKVIALVSVIFGLISAIMILSSGSIIARGSEDQTPYHFWWASAICFAYCGLIYLLNSKNSKLFLFAFLTYFILGMSFLKRSCFLNCIIIVLLSILLSSKQRQMSKTIVSVAVAFILLFLISIFIPNVNDVIFGALFDRFNDTAEDMDNFDRLIEWEMYKSQTTTIQKLTGAGIGNFLLLDRYGVNDLSLLNSLHIGCGDIIYKGGIVYAAFYILMYIKIFSNWFKSKIYSTRYLVCFGVAISSLISLTYEGSWTYTIIPFCISAPIFYAASHTGDSESFQE